VEELNEIGENQPQQLLAMASLRKTTTHTLQISITTINVTGKRLSRGKLF